LQYRYDDINIQWLQVLKECNIKQHYALSRQAKDKIERFYQWIQDHLVRRCISDKVTRIAGWMNKRY
jgi:hypothetical protein